MDFTTTIPQTSYEVGELPKPPKSFLELSLDTQLLIRDLLRYSKDIIHKAYNCDLGFLKKFADLSRRRQEVVQKIKEEWKARRLDDETARELIRYVHNITDSTIENVTKGLEYCILPQSK